MRFFYFEYVKEKKRKVWYIFIKGNSNKDLFFVLEIRGKYVLYLVLICLDGVSIKRVYKSFLVV